MDDGLPAFRVAIVRAAAVLSLTATRRDKAALQPTRYIFTRASIEFYLNVMLHRVYKLSEFRPPPANIATPF